MGDFLAATGVTNGRATSLCAWCDYFRHTVGRYLADKVLGLHDQSMLPPLVMGESTKVAFLMPTLAEGPLN